MIVHLSDYADDRGATTTAAIVPTHFQPRPPAHDEPNIWPFVKAGVISGLCVFFLTRWLDGGSR